MTDVRSSSTSSSTIGPDAEQRRAIESFGRPTIVLAGAGSGKTQTMVWRLVNAFDPAIAGGLALDSIDQALVITFTRVAATKLKRDLREAFEDPAFKAAHPEESSRIDRAWIGTIHAMARRILTESALALDIDPEVEIVDEWRGKELLDQAVDEALRERLAADGGKADRSSTVAELFDAYGLDRVRRMVLNLVGAARISVDRFRTFRLSEAEDPTLRARWRTLLGLAGRTNDIYDAAKRARGVMDNDDLLRYAYEALGRPDLLGRYELRFRQVVVDEVQDVDSLQYQIVRRLSGPNLERLCVVGDINQSIYGFRNANPTLIEGLLDELGLADSEPERTVDSDDRATLVHLVNNYRSANAITSFVNRVFGRGSGAGPSLFRTYRDLVSRGSAAVSGDVAPDHPSRRSTVEVLDCEGVEGLGSNAPALSLEARVIASRFKAIREEDGVPYGGMALLLGRMTDAQTYVEAFNALDIPYAFVGGSVLSRRPVPQMILDTVRVLANPLDDAAAANVLASDLFGFSPDDLLRLTQEVGIPLAKEAAGFDGGDPEADYDEKRVKKLAMRPGWILERLLAREGVPPVDFARLDVARYVLGQAVDRIPRQSMERVVRGVLAESGWLRRTVLEARSVPIKGRAALADADKMLRVIARLEREGAHGPRELAQDLDVYLRREKDTPGFIESEDPGYVSISTVHSAKGEQFDVVAVAQIFERHPFRQGVGPLEMATIGDVTFASLGEAGRADEDAEAVRDLTISEETSSTQILERLEREAREATPERWHRLVHDRHLAANLEESARLAYVALTRAKRRLIVCLPPEGDAASPELADPVARRIREVVCATGADGRMVRTLSPSDVDASLSGPSPTATAPAPAVSEESLRLPSSIAVEPDIHRTVSRRWFEGVVSYSSFSSHAGSEAHRTPSAPDPSSTARGSIFHEVCEYATNRWDGGPLERPSEEVVRALAARHVGEDDVEEVLRSLAAPLERWFSSGLAKSMARRRSLMPEVPFFTSLEVPGRPDPLVVNGSIDLLGYDSPGGMAWICDYKTGYTSLSPDRRRETFRHQALTYAYATLRQGFPTVRLAFLLVDCDAQPGSIEFCRFASDEESWTLESVADELRASIDLDPAGDRR